MIYKVLPDVRIQWRDVWIGAALTSFLFTIGKFLIGLYLGSSGVIFFLGAEFTQVYATQYGSGVVPADNAQPIGASPEAEKRQSPPPENRSATRTVRRSTGWEPDRERSAERSL